MDKNRDHCIIDEMKRGLLGFVLDLVHEDVVSLTEKYAEPEKESPLAKYKTESVLDELCETADGQSFYMETFRPVDFGAGKLPVIIDIHGGGFVRENRRFRRQYLTAMASRGFLAFGFDYILSDDTSIRREIKNICSVLEVVYKRIKDFNTDPERVFMTGDSAGAYLALYIAAMQKSEKLCSVIGRRPPELDIAALGLHSGMFYIDRCDPSGWLLSTHICAMSKKDVEFRRKYIVPECDEVIKNLPPVFLSTSRGDIINDYTLTYHQALRKAGKRSHLVYKGSDDLIHAYASLLPYRSESIDVLDSMTLWFEEQVREAEKEQKALGKINARIESGKIIEQKAWKFIKELNSFSGERLDSLAMIDGRRGYTYRQMFRKWERYAEVFSALGMTGKNGSRVMIRSTPAAETINALFALNMTGASVSLGLESEATAIFNLRAIVENENITDIILPDSHLGEIYLRHVMKAKDDLGIRNVIVMHIPRMGEFAEPGAERESLCRYRRFKSIEGVLFMEDLLEKYEAAPICYAEDECDQAAMITHTSGTTTGASKPVPMSDRGVNETATRLLKDDRFKHLKGRASTSLAMELGSAYVLCNELFLPFAFGGRVALLPPASKVGMGLNVLEALSYYHVNVFFSGPGLMEILMRMPVHPDLSDLELVFLGGSYASVDARKRYNRYLRQHGSKARVTIGYGLSEAGGACMISSPDREDDAMGWPLKGIKIKLYDEEKDVFYDAADGPAEGVMFMSSPAVSCGRIDDKVFFELKEIDGEEYLNTYDLVRTGEDGAFFYIGRMNKFFVNNSMVRFDAGLVERAVSAQPMIESCGLAPGYDKILRDTIPVLYVKATMPAEDARDSVNNALKGAFITEGAIKDSNLPMECIITDNIPYNASGKVDIHQITTGNVDGYRYRVIPVRHGGRLVDIRLNTYKNSFLEERGLPEELANGR